MTGRAPSGRATHERSQSPLSPPTAGVPNAAHGLSGAAYDTLHCLFVHGPTFDGDVPSKCGRDELVKRRLAMRHDGYQTLTIGGLRLALKLGMDRKKEKQGRELRELLANATQNRNIAEQARLLSKSHARAESLLQRVVDTTHCHIDGRDLLAEIHPRRFLGITRRVDSVETCFEADWLTTLWGAVKEAKAFLYSREIECRKAAQLASAMSAGTAKTPQAVEGEARQRDPRGDANA
jgi:hypothetical protein